MPKHSSTTPFILLLATLTVALTYSSCRSQQAESEEQQSLRTAAQGYLDAMANYRFDDAIPYASRETCESTIPLFHSILAATDSSFLKDYMPATIQIDSVQHAVGDSIAIVFFTKTMPLGTRRQQLTMICRNNTWQAHVITATPEALKPHKPLTNDDLKHLKIKKVTRRAAADSMAGSEQNNS